MADSKPIKSLNFQEFPSISTKEWEDVISRDLKGKNYKEELRWETLEGIDILPFYRQENLQNLTHKTEPINISADWDIVEKIDIPDLRKANKQILEALQNGASGLLLDLPTSVIKSKSDLELLLKEVRIDFISVHFEPGLSSPKLSKWLTEICKESNIDVDSLNITFAFDPFSHAIRSGKLAKKQEILDYYKDLNLSFKTFAVDAAFYGNCGASIVQQIAFALAEGNEFLALADDLDRDVLDISSKLHFNFSTASGYFLEIAKYRAFRLVWGQVMNAYKNDISGKDQIYIHAKTARWNKSASDAHNNLIRATTEAMSAAIGGCNAVTVERFDQDFADHSVFSARIARNIQLIIQGEAYLDKVSDAGAGSYYIEVLTDNLALEGWKLFQEIEQHGGFYEAVKSGFIQKLLSKSKEKRIEAYKNNETILVGVNKYEAENEQKPDSNRSKKIEIFPFKDFYEVNTVSELKIEETLQHDNGDSTK